MTYPYPDNAGRYGAYGGRYVAETLYEPLLKVEAAFEAVLLDETFMARYHDLLHHYVGRETPLYHAQNLSRHLGGPQIYLKREDLNHTGAHKINNAIGQCLLAKSMGFDAVIAETGAGQHGVATATAAALLGLRCDVFMGESDIQRQMTNVQRMRLLGATLHPVSTGTKTLKDATNAAIQHWTCHVDDVFYVIGSAIGPHPYPYMVRHFQSVIGLEVRRQLKAQNLPEPAAMVACVGGGSNAIGFFHPFVETPTIALYAVEAAGKGLTTEQHAATLTKGKTGVLHGTMMKILQSPEGNIHEAFSISAGLDYPGVGPEHCHLNDTGRITALSATDDEALDAFLLLTKLEGILPALESAHAIAGVTQLAQRFLPSDVVVINLSGRGDKDMDTVLKEVSNREQTR